ncbi:MAG: D-alanyl-D-alanine carboxypeptidase [Alphaproteobacteria bacterium]|nr:D-alanyl-D-alanine carboxypeptidase [Alphaproteobacteria bacterium]
MRYVAVLIAAWAGLFGAGPAPGPLGPMPSAQAQSRERISINSPHAILIDAETGSVLFEKRSDQLIAPASLAKLMTVEVVLDQIKLGNLKLTDEFVISENAWRKGGAVSRGSTMYAVLHSRVKVEDLLQGTIIQSGNDASIALAEGIGGNEAGFTRIMNDRARELGMTKSHFTNAAGLPDPHMRVTPRELALLSRHIIRTYPEHYRWYAEREFTWNKIRQQNRNPLLTLGIGADGLKTGFTNEAGYCLVGSAVQNDLRLVVVIAGAKTPKDRADEAKKLLEWGFRSFESRLLFADGQTIADAKIYGGTQGRVALMAKGEVKLMVPRTAGERLSARVIYTGPVPAPVREGQPIGTLQVRRGDVNVLEVPVHAAESVEAGSVSQRAFDAAAEIVINLFRSAAKRL